MPYQLNLPSANREGTISAINDLDLNIVDSHGGFFWAVSSALGIGARFGRPVQFVSDAKAQISALKLANCVQRKTPFRVLLTATETTLYGFAGSLKRLSLFDSSASYDFDGASNFASRYRTGRP